MHILGLLGDQVFYNAHSWACHATTRRGTHFLKENFFAARFALHTSTRFPTKNFGITILATAL